MSATLEQIEEQAMTDLKAKHYQEIVELQAESDERHAEYETQKAKAGAAKKRWEEAESNKAAAIRRGPNKQAELPFRDDWRDVPIGDAIELTEKQAEKLAEFGIKTVGDFEKQRGGEGLTAIPGVGEATADKWADQVMDFVAQAARETDDAEPEDEGDDDSDEDEGDED